jgi:hypothetical protein
MRARASVRLLHGTASTSLSIFSPTNSCQCILECENAALEDGFASDQPNFAQPSSQLGPPSA